MPNGRHFIEPSEGNPEWAHVMQSSYPGALRVTDRPLPTREAQAHADSLNQNDADDLRRHGRLIN